MPATADPGPGAAAAATGPFDGDWPALANRLQLPGRLGEFMRQSEFLGQQGGQFEVRVPIQMLADERLLQRVGEALSVHFGTPVRLTATVGSIAGRTAAGLAELERVQRLSRLRDHSVRPFRAIFANRIQGADRSGIRPVTGRSDPLEEKRCLKDNWRD
ncbi:MAG: hypothetical protein R3E68_06430 [Burkholderiaceae bacterium]